MINTLKCCFGLCCLWRHPCSRSKSFVYDPGSNDWEHIVFVLSVCLSVCLFVCLSVINFNIRYTYNFWTARDRDFILSIPTQLMVPVWLTLNDLDFDLYAKNSISRLCCHRRHMVSQTGIFFYNFCLEMAVCNLWSHSVFRRRSLFGAFYHSIVLPFIIVSVCWYANSHFLFLWK